MSKREFQFNLQWSTYPVLIAGLAIFSTLMWSNGCGSGFKSIVNKSDKSTSVTLDGQKITCEDRQGEIQTYEISTLTPYQYLYTLEDLLGRSLSTTETDNILLAAGKAPLPTSQNGYDNNTVVAMSTDFFSSKLSIGRIYGQALRSQVIQGCTTKSCVQNQLKTFLGSVLPKIYPTSQIGSIQAKLLALFESSYQIDPILSQAVEDTLTALFSSSTFHLKFLSDDGQVVMTPIEIGRKLSYFLLSSLPDNSLTKDIENGSIVKSEVRAGHVKRILSNPQFLRRFSFQFLSQFLGFNGTYQGSSSGTFNGINRKDIYDSEILFFEYLLKNNLPIHNLIDSGIVIANNSIAAKFNLSGTNGTSLIPVPSDTYSGILTHPLMFMKTYKDDEKKLYVSRGARIQERFICQELPQVSQATLEEIKKIDNEIKDRSITSMRDIIDYHRSNPACFSCHQYIDGFGVSLEKFDSFGQFRSSYADGTPVDARGELLGKSYMDQVDMGAILSRSIEFKSCFVRQLNAFASQRNFFQKSNCLVVDAVNGATEDMPLGNLIQSIAASPQFMSKRQN